MKIILHTVFLCAMLWVSPGKVQSQNHFFVSPSGNDGDAGTEQSPFATIRKAQQEARGVPGETVIYLRQGIYRLSEPLVFNPEDGNETKSLTVKAYPGERVLLSGGMALELSWKPHRNGIFKSAVTGRPAMDVLIADGGIRPMARFPNYDPAAVRFNGTSADATSPERIRSWGNPKGGYLHVMQRSDWGSFHYRFTGKAAPDSLSLEGGHQNNRRNGLHGSNRMVENIFEELDAPGEWYYDAQTSTLYYYTYPGEDPSEMTFETPQLKHLIELRGTGTSPVKNIRFENIGLTQTVRTFMEEYEPLLRSDWMVYRGAALFIEGAEDCTFRGGELFNLGGNAVFVSRYNRGVEIAGNHIHDIGASAILFVGDPGAVRSPAFEYRQSVPVAEIDRTPGPKTDHYPAGCTAHDNLIHDIGFVEKQVTGVELSMSRNITVSHNSIYDTPRAGINISEGTWGGHLIEYNDVFATVKETGDHGSLNAWGRDRFWRSKRTEMDSLVAVEPALILADAVETTVIRHNRFHCDRGWDIDLDDGATNYHIYKNLCLNGGLKIREGFYRVVENNILVNNSFYSYVWFRDNQDYFCRNICMTPYKPGPIPAWRMRADDNTFTDSLSLQSAQSVGTDGHSIAAPVVFRDPRNGDYSVAEDSEAIRKTGFQNFSMDRFGVVSPHLKHLARKPPFPFPVILSDTPEAQAVSWSGIHIKNLDNLGERSATGMDSERGVYVAAVDGRGNLLRDYIKPNDVILGLNGKTVDNLDDLYGAIHSSDISKPLEMVIFRDQQESRFILPAGAIKGNIRE